MTALGEPPDWKVGSFTNVVVGPYLPLEGEWSSRLESERPGSAVGTEYLGRFVELNGAANHRTVAAAIREANGLFTDRRREELTPGGSLPAADLEDVGEITGDIQLDPEIDRSRLVIRERQLLEERLLEHQIATDVNGVLRVPGVPAERVVGHGEIQLCMVRCDHLCRQ